MLVVCCVAFVGFAPSAGAQTDTTPPVIVANILRTIGPNGWYTAAITVTWSVTDPESTITSRTGCGNTFLSADTTGITLTCTATSAGGTASVPKTVKIDTKPPTLSPVVVPSVIQIGSTTAVVEPNAADATSGLASVHCGALNTTTLGTRGVSCTATDYAGWDIIKGAQYTVADLTPPTVTPSVTGPVGANDWYVGAVIVSWLAIDPDTAVTRTGCGTVTLTADTPGTTLTCTAMSAGGTTSRSVTVKIDATSPSLAPTATPSSVPVGGTVMIAPNASDAMSGVDVATCQDADTSTVGTFSVSCTVADRAGHVASASVSYTVTDDTAPLVAPTVTGPIGSGGWYTGPVAIAWLVSDPDSAVTTSGCEPVTLPADTPGETITCSATSAGGATSESVTVKIDATAPSLAPTVTPVPVPVGETVVIAANATDVGSGLASAVCDAADTSQVGTFTVSCIAVDGAGNSASAPVTYSVIDPTPPQIAPIITGPIGTGAWYTGPVAIAWLVSDPESAVTTWGCEPVTLSADTTGTTVSCTATSSGGTMIQSVLVKIDATAPSLAPTATPAPVSVGGSLVVDANAEDEGSGLMSAICDAADTTTAGTFSVSCSAIDNAGNIAYATVSYTVIDTIPIQYSFGGFQAPVASHGSITVGRAGRAIPLKWTLFTAEGAAENSLSAVSSIVYVSVSCTAPHDELGGPMLAADSGGSGLRVDALTSVYQFNWSMPSVAGCYRIDLALSTGQTFSALFGLT